MNERITSKVDEVLEGRKLAYSTTNFLKFPLGAALEKIAEGGFVNVEVWGNNKHLDPRNPDLEPREARRLCDGLGLRVTSIHAPFTLEHNDDPAARMREWESLVRRSLEQAEILGASQLVVHPVVAGRDESDSEYREAAGRTEDSLLRLADAAGARGLSLAIENMPAHRSRRYGRNVAELYRFVASCGRDNLGLCLDTGHVVFNNGDPVAEFTGHLDRIFNVHMNDNIWGMHMDLHLVPGAGSVNWKAFREALGDPRFHGIIVLELDDRGRPTSIFSEAVEFVNRYFSAD